MRGGAWAGGVGRSMAQKWHQMNKLCSCLLGQFEHHSEQQAEQRGAVRRGHAVYLKALRAECAAGRATPRALPVELSPAHPVRGTVLRPPPCPRHRSGRSERRRSYVPGPARGRVLAPQGLSARVALRQREPDRSTRKTDGAAARATAAGPYSAIAGATTARTTTASTQCGSRPAVSSSFTVSRTAGLDPEQPLISTCRSSPPRRQVTSHPTLRRVTSSTVQPSAS